MKRDDLTNRETIGLEVLEVGRVPVKAWTRGVPVEDQARDQLRNVASLPFVFKHVAVMPDVHWGMGATVGSVIATKGAIVPAAVGVDIGCGMVAARLTLSAANLPDNLAGVRSAIEAAVPHGRTDYGGRNDRGAWGNPPPEVWEVMGDDGPLRARLVSIVDRRRGHRVDRHGDERVDGSTTPGDKIDISFSEPLPARLTTNIIALKNMRVLSYVAVRKCDPHGINDANRGCCSGSLHHPRLAASMLLTALC